MLASLFLSLTMVAMPNQKREDPPGNKRRESYGSSYSPYIKIAPKAHTMKAGETATFNAEMNYPPGMRYIRQPVKWTVLEKNGGSVTMNGVYTAPVKKGTYHLRAIREDIEGKHDTATIKVE
jgi:hypothetical protein